MPGIGDNPIAFQKAGFFDDLDITFDTLVVDSHFAYYREKQLVERLYLDIIKPATTRYSKITLLGISLGSYGALLVAQKYPQSVDQIILFSPFLGDLSLVDDIIANGGLEKWYLTQQQNNNTLGFGDNAWLYLQQLISSSEVKIVLAYGMQDKFSSAADLLSSNLSTDLTIQIKGKHNWVTWSKLWRKLLEENIL